MGEEVYRNLSGRRKELLDKSRQDEAIVQRLLTKFKDGYYEPSTTEEDIYKHIDFWWITKGKKSNEYHRYGVDVKNSKKTSYVYGVRNEDIGSWVQIYARHEQGIKGWMYSEANYIAFLADNNKKVIMVTPAALQRLYNERVAPLLERNGYYKKERNTQVIPFQPYIRDINSIFYVPQVELERIADKVLVDEN